MTYPHFPQSGHPALPVPCRLGFAVLSYSLDSIWTARRFLMIFGWFGDGADDGAGAFGSLVQAFRVRVLLLVIVVLAAVGAGQDERLPMLRRIAGEISQVLFGFRVIYEDALSLVHATPAGDAMRDQPACRTCESQERRVDRGVFNGLVHQMEPLHGGSDLVAWLYHGTFSTSHSLMTLVTAF